MYLKNQQYLNDIQKYYFSKDENKNVTIIDIKNINDFNCINKQIELSKKFNMIKIINIKKNKNNMSITIENIIDDLFYFFKKNNLNDSHKNFIFEKIKVILLKFSEENLEQSICINLNNFYIKYIKNEYEVFYNFFSNNNFDETKLIKKLLKQNNNEILENFYFTPKREIDMNNFKKYNKFFNENTILYNILNIFFDYLINKEKFFFKNWNNNNYNFFIDINDFYNNFFSNIENFKKFIKFKYIDYINDIIYNILIECFSILFYKKEEFNLYLMCYNDFQNIKNVSIQTHLKNKIINIYYVNDNIKNYFINNDLKSIEILINIIKTLSINDYNILTNLINNSSVTEDDKNILKIIEEMKLQNNEFFMNNFFISSFVYYCLSKDIHANKEGVFNFNEGYLSMKNASTLLKGVKNCSNIKKINMQYNQIGALGMYELNKIILFNNIKKINLDKNNLKSNDLKYLVLQSNIKNNDNLKLSLNVSYNNLDEKSIIYLQKLLNYIPNIYHLNLSNNFIGKGLKNLFSSLIYMTKKNKCKLKNLYLGNCNIDNASFFQLANYVTLKNCQLEILNLNYNNLNNIAGHHFLKKMKYNKSINELYLYNCNIKNREILNLKNIVKFSQLNTLSLFKNQINIYENVLNFYSIFQIIMNEKQNFYFPITYNIDISENDFLLLEKEDINLFKKFIGKNIKIFFDYYDIKNKIFYN